MKVNILKELIIKYIEAGFVVAQEPKRLAQLQEERRFANMEHREGRIWAARLDRRIEKKKAAVASARSGFEVAKNNLSVRLATNSRETVEILNRTVGAEWGVDLLALWDEAKAKSEASEPVLKA